MRKTLLMMGTSTARPAVSCMLMSATFMVLRCLRMIPPRPWELLRGLSSLFLKAWSSVDQLEWNFMGGFNQDQVIPLGMRFGPFDGEVSSQEKTLESAYSWVICRGGDQYNYTDAERDAHSNWMRYVVCSDEEEVQALSCPYCQYSFPAAVYLHRHVRRSHPDEYTHLSVAQAFEPVEQTPVTNLDQCLLASDAPSSSQERPYRCSLCLKSFTQLSGLKWHQENHLCHSTNRQSAALADATIYPVNVMSKDHSCTQCSKIFRTIRGFKNHACFRQGDQLYLS
ncbi:hypothetical protein AOLI_G00253720 [Acnodon oligacanthus]